MPLTVGTAGHIDHGKTTLVEALTGKNTDRLPRGAGARHLDRPRLRAARAAGRDAALRRRRPRTRALRAHDGRGRDRHRPVPARDRRERGRAAADARAPRDPAAARDRARCRRAHEVRSRRRGDARARTRRGGGARARRSRRGRERAHRRRSRRAARRARARSSTERARDDAPTRLYVDRVFTLHGIGTVATGTLWSGIDRRGRRAARPRTRASACAACRSTTAPSSEPRPASASPSRCPAWSARSFGAATRSSRPAPTRRATASTSRSSRWPRSRRACIVHHGTASVLARVVRVGDRFAQLRLAEPVVAARGDRVVLRAATTVGGGRVLDPAPPRHASLERMELVDRGEIAATVHEPVRAESLAHLGELTGVMEADGWVFSGTWLEELRAELDARLERADPLDPGIAPPPEAWSGAVVPLLGLERRGAKLYRPGSTAELGAHAAAAAALEAQLGLEPVQVDDACARALPRGAGTPRPRRRRVRGLACGLRAGAQRRSSPSAKPPGGSRSPASATCSASGGRRRSCCSSASTPTG